MKIKRFEASSMSDALRMIKKEFGEDAVILSAKTMKKNSGLLGNKRPQKVVVTAAVDNAPANEPAITAQDMDEKTDPGFSKCFPSRPRHLFKVQLPKKISADHPNRQKQGQTQNRSAHDGNSGRGRPRIG